MTKETAKVRDKFSDKAAGYSARAEWPSFVYKMMLQKAGFDHSNKEALRNIVAVDMGAGTGKTTFPLADMGCTVIAVEPNPEMFKVLQERAKKGGYDNVIVVQGDAFNHNIPEEFKGKVDLFYSGNSAHWWSSRMNTDPSDRDSPTNPPGQERKAVEAWLPYAATGAQVSIMYLRAAEQDQNVIQLNQILLKHFEKTRKNPTQPCEMRLFEFSAFKDYFNSRSKREDSETYIKTQFPLKDYEHFQDWLKSYSYFPNDGFENAEANKDLRAFYEQLKEQGNGVAKIPFGVRVYTGLMRGVSQHPANDVDLTDTKKRERQVGVFSSLSGA